MKDYLEGLRQRRRDRGVRGRAELVFAVLLTVTMFTFPGHPFTLTDTLFCLLMLSVVYLATWTPWLAAVASMPVLPVALFILGQSGSFFFLITALVVELLAAQGLLRLAATVAVVQGGASLLDLTDMTVSTDPVGLMLVGLTMLGGYTVGYTRYSQVRRRRELQQSLMDEQRNQRLAMARELHDLVATDLTSVVMQAQVLELHPIAAADDELHQQLADISESSRRALESLRAMLRVLNTELPEGSEDSSAPKSVQESLRATVRELKAHRFRVRQSVSLPADVQVDRQVVARVLTEMRSNAVKHSPPRSEIILTCTVAHDELVLTMSNERLPTPEEGAGDDTGLPGDLLSSHIGLASMSGRAAVARGTVTAGPEKNDPQRWRTQLKLPIVGTG
ncbi:sensor histidine kinase [Corynebacterium terpenotabidum]|uniref:histidine kinase n=1 Tax=Corynebacterium terpenotabidum Y-11 TaxID=1200352 RepID=S4XE91_9CORY|nr:histidine kinase [Corynebacterium terpenotabidum]AGP29920.1 hypothetical protein A606_01325 [Corynebacterium terpenotabidum Y-11]